MKKTVIIYGSGVIALAAAEALTEAGLSVVILTADIEKVDASVKEKYQVCQIDPADENSIYEVVSKFENVYGLFNAELAISRKAIRDITDESLREMFDKNVLYFFHTARACAKVMGPNGGGRIVNLSSVHSKVGDGYHLEYAVATAAINAMTRELSVGYWKDKIQVNSILAAFVDGQFDCELDLDQRIAPEKLSLIGRRLTAEDIAKTVRFLFTSTADCIIGEEIRADAGYMTTQWRIGDTPFVKITDKNY